MSDRPRSSPLIPGYWLDRYELLCPIAVGGMAEAWVARLQGKFGFEKLVAVKTILPTYAADPLFQRMFLDEARIASRIEHTNVAQTLDLGEERGVLYIVMEWVDGDPLRKIHQVVEKKGAPLPPGILLRIVADVCGGLHAAHELRGPDGALLDVVHRDVSPQNILVSTRGEAKLIDFGVAKARDRLAGETNSGMVKGKVLYMAPEQALGLEVDRRADVWAIGALLYHLLTGRPPYDGPNSLARLHLLTSRAPAPPLPPEVPEPVARVVLRALSHSLDGRPATAAEMQAEIEHAMVEANLATTVADVASFIGLHLADRAAHRKQAIELALRAAFERLRIEPLLRLPRHDSVVERHPSSAPTIEIEAPQPATKDQAAGPPSVPTSSSQGDSRRLPPGVAASHRVLGAAMGILLCTVIAAVVFVSRAERRQETTAEHLQSTPLAASARLPPAVPEQKASPAAPAPAERELGALGAPADAAKAAPEAKTAGTAAASRSPHPPPQAPATPPARAAAPSAQPTAAKSIPEVIDNGF